VLDEWRASARAELNATRDNDDTDAATTSANYHFNGKTTNHRETQHACTERERVNRIQCPVRQIIRQSKNEPFLAISTGTDKQTRS